MSERAARMNLPSLTGARWWAAVAVFVLHALVFLPIYPFQKSHLFATIHSFVPMQLGSAGVTFFFILSGFLIYWSNSSIATVKDAAYYWRRRITKIYPMHLISLLLFVGAASLVAGYVADTTAGRPTHVYDVAAPFPLGHLSVWLPNALLIHTYNPSWVMIGGLNVPSWSLASEMLFYLTFPLIVPLVRRISDKKLWWWFIGVFAASLIVITLVHLYASGSKSTHNFFVPRLWDQDTSPVCDVHAHPAWFAQDVIPVDHTYWLSYYFPPTRLLEFYLGVFSARLIVAGKFKNLNIIWPLCLLAVSFAATWLVPVAYKMSVIMSVPMALVVATLAARDIAGVSRRIGRPRMVLLGNMSFPFYMVQFPVMVAIQRVFFVDTTGGFFTWLLAAVMSFVVSAALSWVLFRFVDDPLMRATSKRSTGRRKKRRFSNIISTDVAAMLGR